MRNHRREPCGPGAAAHEIKNTPSWLFWDLNTKQSFSPLSELGTLSNESQTIEVHVRAADHGHKFLLRSYQLVVDDVTLQSGKRESPCRLSDRPRFCSSI